MSLRMQIRDVIARRDTDKLLYHIHNSDKGDFLIPPDNTELQLIIKILSEDIDACRELLSISKDWVNARNQDGITPLYAASERGHVNVCRLLITEGHTDVNKASDNIDGVTPLCAASERGHVNVCRLLITEGHADVNKASYISSNITPLYAASECGHVEVCRVLIIEGNADANKDIRHGYTPLYAASKHGSIDVCRLLITEGNAGVNKASDDGRTPLYAASECDNVNVCRLLITEGNADVNKASDFNITPLNTASECGHVEVCRLLIIEGNADVNIASRAGITPLCAASERGYVDVCRLLITEGNADVNKASDDGSTPLYVASRCGHVELCRLLIIEGNADVNQATGDGSTALHAASKYGHVELCKLLITEGNADVNKATRTGITPLCAASERGYVDVCRLLITEGNADVNKASDAHKHDGSTPLYVASKYGQVELCRLLITEGNADVNQAIRTGITPLCAASERGYVDVCRLLITEGNADVNRASDYGSTPLYVASKYGHVELCRLLITEGNADVNQAIRDGSTALYAASEYGHVELCKLLITEGNADVNKATRTGTTPLCAASGRRYVDVCRLLITEGNADVNKASDNGGTPLHEAVRTKQLSVCKMILETPDVDPNQVDQNGGTPLHEAVRTKQLSVCKMILETPDVDPNQVDQKGGTPLHEAVRTKQLSVCKMILETPDVDPNPVDQVGKVPLDYWPIQQQFDERQMLKKYIKAAERTILLRSGGTPVRTIKLYLVGDPAKGKSTLKKSLSSGLVTQFLQFLPISKQTDHIATPGINVEAKKVRGAGSFMIWDTAGQVEFHITHAMMLDANRGIFLAVYSCCDLDDEQTKQLKYWACFIKTCHDPTEQHKPRVQLVGTHIDSVQDRKTATAVFHKHLHYLKTVFGDQMHISEEVILVDSRQARSGLRNLKGVLNKLAEPLRGELMPKICDEISKRIASWCSKTLPLLYYTEFKQKVRSKIDKQVTDETLRLAVSYLHNMGEVHHAKLQKRDSIIIVHPNWLTTTIFAPIFASLHFRADYSGLPLNQEYTVEDLRWLYFHVEDLNLLIELMEYFELAYRNEDGTFNIPAKLPKDTPDIVWRGESKKYFGRRIACRHEGDMFSTDMFPCLQVSMMNRYRQKNVKPLLSRFGVKVFGTVEGMAQLTRDKRAVHIAVRVMNDEEINKGRDQLQEMESLVFEQIDERSKGTKVSTSFLSPGDLKKSTNLEDGVSFYTESAMQDVIEKQKAIVHPTTLVPESTFDVNPSISDVSGKETYAKVCEAVHVLCYSSLPTVQTSIEAWHQGQQQIIRPCLNSIHCQPHKKPTTKSGACQPCVDWGKAVESVCFPVGKGVEWRNVTASLFHNDPVEVAKAFLFKIPPGQILTKFGDFDVGGVLKLMMGFREYHKGDQACYDKMGKVLGIRNTLSHMKLEDNMMIAEKQVDESLDAIEDVVASLKIHQPTLKDDEIKSKLKQIRQSRVTPAMMTRATGDLPDSLRQALDEWLEKNKKGIAEAVWEDPHLRKLEQDVTEIKGDIKKLLAGAHKSC